MMTFSALHPYKTMFQPATFEVIDKFLLPMQRQWPALHGHHIPEFRVVFLNERESPFLASPCRLVGRKAVTGLIFREGCNIFNLLQAAQHDK